ncbi:MAG: hypothetical protein CMM87_00010 [Rickettsiales bacterium]|nr:hypothetical protein [Rickettsiales bacterium]
MLHQELYFGRIGYKIEGEAPFVNAAVSYCLKWGPYSSKSKINIDRNYKIKLSKISDRGEFINDLLEHSKSSLSKERFFNNKEIFVICKEGFVFFIPQQTDFNIGYPILIHNKDNHSFEVVCSNSSSELDYFLWSLLKEIYITFYESNGWILYHANGLSLNEKEGLIFMAGPKCGKSTLMCALTAYAPPAFPLADDRLLVKNNNIQAVPSIANFDMRNLNTNHPFHGISSLIAKKSERHENYLELSILSLASGRGSLHYPYISKAIIIPKYSADLENDYKFIPVKKNEFIKIIKENVISPHERWRDKYMWDRNNRFDEIWVNQLSNMKAFRVLFRGNINQKKLCEDLLKHI